MKHLGIVTNLSWPTVGGQQILTHVLGREMARRGHRVTIMSSNIREETEHEGVRYISASRIFNGSPDDIFSAIEMEGFTSLHVHGDYCRQWPFILSHAPKIGCHKSIYLCGMYRAQAEPSIMTLMDAHQKEFKLLTGNYFHEDSNQCRRKMFRHEQVHPLIDVKAFRPSATRDEFRKKHGIQTKHLILYVANMMPGKGHENLIPLGQLLNKMNEDYTFGVVAHSSPFPIVNHLMGEFPKFAEKNGVKVKPLYDLSRQEVIDSYFASDLFVNMSMKETYVLNIYESMVAGLPYVSMAVGELQGERPAGGMIIQSPERLDEDAKHFDSFTCNNFACAVHDLLKKPEERLKIGDDGKKSVDDSWDYTSVADRWEIELGLK